MKKLIVTRADNNIKQMTNITLPIMENYAQKCNADFKIMSHKAPFLTSDNKPHYRILKVMELLEEYDRVLCLDADMLINKNCPNIFDIVPVDKIGSIFEDKGSRTAMRRSKIKQIQKEWGNVGWETGYTNAGTFILSRQHKDIFLPHNNKYWLNWGSADLHLSYNIHKLKFEIFELDYKWNHMTMFSEGWNNNADRFDSHIIHYAGVGIFDKKNNGSRIKQIINDKIKIYD